MIKDSDVEKVLRVWLEQGSDRLPDRVARSVIEGLAATTQRRRRRFSFPWTFRTRVAKVAVGAAAILVASTVAFALLPRGLELGGISTPPSATPSAPPTPSTPAPTPTSTARPAGAMDPGRYRMEAPFRAPFSITFGTSWIARSVGSANAEFLKADSLDGQAAWVTVHLVEGVLVDPCHPELGDVTPAPATVDALLRALTGLKGFVAGPVTDVRLGGLPAKSVIIRNSIDTEAAGCGKGPMLPMWTFGGGQQAATNGGGTERLSVLLVHGRLVVIDGESFPGTPSSAIEEIQAVIDSIVFE